MNSIIIHTYSIYINHMGNFEKINGKMEYESKICYFDQNHRKLIIKIN